MFNLNCEAKVTISAKLNIPRSGIVSEEELRQNILADLSMEYTDDITVEILSYSVEEIKKGE